MPIRNALSFILAIIVLTQQALCVLPSLPSAWVSNAGAVSVMAQAVSPSPMSCCMAKTQCHCCMMGRCAMGAAMAGQGLDANHDCCCVVHRSQGQAPAMVAFKHIFTPPVITIAEQMHVRRACSSRPLFSTDHPLPNAFPVDSPPPEASLS